MAYLHPNLFMNRLKVFIWLALVSISLGMNERKDITRLVAHRGASYDAPENTIAAVKEAFRQGADAIEVDVHLSADKKVMVIHDDSTGRTAGTNWRVANATADSLRQLEVGSWKNPRFKGEKIPLLEEVLKEMLPEKELFVEVKSDPETITYLKPTIARWRSGVDISVISFSFDVLRESKRLMPETPAFLVASPTSKQGLMSAIDSCMFYGFEGIHVQHEWLTQDVVAAAKGQQLEVHAWTVNQPSRAKTLQNMGVDGITTDRPALLKPILEED